MLALQPDQARALIAFAGLSDPDELDPIESTSNPEVCSALSTLFKIAGHDAIEPGDIVVIRTGMADNVGALLRIKADFGDMLEASPVDRPVILSASGHTAAPGDTVLVRRSDLQAVA